MKKTVTKIIGNEKIVVKLRYNDECKNGHKDFAITADLYKKRPNGVLAWVAGGCLHDEIKRLAPEFSKYIKWHLCGENGPMHYIANTLYHAGDRDYNGKRKGEAISYKKGIRFGDFPVAFYKGRKFTESLEQTAHKKDLTLVKVEHPQTTGDNYKYDPKYTLSCFYCEWYNCPFDTEEEAEQFLQALKKYNVNIITTPDRISEGKERDLEAARESAIWPEATDEQLCQEPEVLKKALEERLPALIEEFKKAMQELGIYED